MNGRQGIRIGTGRIGARRAWRTGLALALALGTLPMTAQAVDCGVEENDLGNLENVDLGLGQFTVDGSTFETDGDTRYRNRDGDDVTLAAFTAGMYVEVEWCPGSGTPPIATKLKMEDAGGGCEDEIRGFVQSPDPVAQTLVLSGVNVTLAPGAELLDDDNNPVAFTVFASGVFAEAEGCTQTDGSLLADKVKLEDGDDDDNFATEFRGVIESTDPALATLVVAGRTVTTSPTTRLRDDDNNTITFADLVPGLFVEVEGGALASGAVFATKIKIEDDGPGDVGGEHEIRGAITAIPGDGSFIVNGTVVLTTPATTYLDDNNNAITAGDFATGEFVEAEGIVNADGSLTARKIKKEDRVGIEIEFRGTIGSITGDVFTVNGQEVLTTAATRFLDNDNAAITAGDFAAGDFVEVEGVRNGDGVLVASKVKMEDAGAPSGCVSTFETSGTITAPDPIALTLTINGFLFQAGPATEFKDATGATVAFDAFTAGAVAKGEGTFDPATGIVLACEVKLSSGTGGSDDGGGADPTLTRLLGTIGTIDTAASTFTVDGTTVRVNPTTTITDRRNMMTLTLADLLPGWLVEVEGSMLIDGTFSARSIHVEEENVDGTEDAMTSGLVQSLEFPASFTVNGTVIDLSAGPAVSTYDDTATTADAIAIGDYVSVEGTADGANIIAASIEVRGSVIGSVDADTLSFTTGGRTVSTTGATTYTEADGTAIAFINLAVGDLVDLEGSFTGPNAFTATEIRRLDPVIFSGPVAFFTATTYTNAGGAPTLRATDAANTYGFVQTPVKAFGSPANTLYEINARVSSNIIDPLRVPGLRLRANAENYSRSAYLVMESYDAGAFSPTPAGRDYKLYFVPSVPPTGSFSSVNDWNFSFDMLNFGGHNDPNGALTLESLDVRPVAKSRIQVAQTLVKNDFASTTDGWFFTKEPNVFTSPQKSSGLNGTLDLASVDLDTYGYWLSVTGVAATPGTLYRARFFVRSSSRDPERTADFRVRLHTNNFEYSSVLYSGSFFGAEESPDARGRAYDVYMQIPADAPANLTLYAAMDILGFEGSNDAFTPISLDHFLLERVTIAP